MSPCARAGGSMRPVRRSRPARPGCPTPRRRSRSRRRRRSTRRARGAACRARARAAARRRGSGRDGDRRRAGSVRVTALGGRGEAEQVVRADGGRELREPLPRQPVTLVDHDRVPERRAEPLDQVAAGDAVDGGEQVIVLLGHDPAAQYLSERVVAEHLAVRPQRLAEDLRAVGDEEQPRTLPAQLRDGVAVVERRDDGLARPGGGDDQVPPPPLLPLLLGVNIC
jgi:hypothetical protein